MIPFNELKGLLNEYVLKFNKPAFIENDPICIPHRFTKQQDIEIAGFIAATFAWGQRKTIINKCIDFLSRMDHTPYEFINHFTANDLKSFKGFKHRTFNEIDAIYFLITLQRLYQEFETMELVFAEGISANSKHTQKGLEHFYQYFFKDVTHPKRTRKHVATPAKKSACKRLNMFLRWMVRYDDAGVDFGIWKKIKMNQLICPVDVHVGNIARQLGLISEQPYTWKTALALTKKLKTFDPNDPVKYDFALFGLGLEGIFFE